MHLSTFADKKRQHKMKFHSTRKCIGIHRQSESKKTILTGFSTGNNVLLKRLKWRAVGSCQYCTLLHEYFLLQFSGLEVVALQINCTYISWIVIFDN